MSSTLSLMPIVPTSASSSLPLPTTLIPDPVEANTSLTVAHLTNSLYKRDLSTYLEHIWQHHFADLPRANEVQIAYCRPWKSRLGLIRMSLDNAVSFIGINSLLRSPRVPEHVLITTIAHELVHYAHGFGSPLPRLYEHPHANRVVEQELERRGLASTLRDCDVWIEEEWYNFYANRKNRIVQ